LPASKPHSRKGNQGTKQAQSLPYENEYKPNINIAADPVIAYMNAGEMKKAIDRMRSEMVAAAKDMDFMEAARLRDEIVKMEALLKDKK
jgi:excinuclease ABC subunit B